MLLVFPHIRAIVASVLLQPLIASARIHDARQNGTQMTPNQTGFPPCDALISAGLEDRIILATSEAYESRVQSWWSANARLRPWCFVQPQSSQEVSQIIRVLADVSFGAGDWHVAVRSGGHSFPYSNNIANGVTIDLGMMNGSYYNPNTNLASVEPGATWKDVCYNLLHNGNVTVTGGRDGGVGVGGFLLGGGNSYYAGRTGLGCDTVVNFEVVLANGSIVEANAKNNPALCKALKGGGLNFGIVTRCDLLVLPAVDLAYGQSVITSNHSDEVLEAVKDFTDHPEELAADALITVYIYDTAISEDMTIVVIRANTNGDLNTTSFDKINKIPAVTRTWEHLTLADAANGSQIAAGTKNTGLTLTFLNSPSILRKSVFLYNGLVSSLSEKIGPETFYAQMFFQPFPTYFGKLAQRNGGNVLGLDRIPSNAILWTAGVGIKNGDDSALAVAQAALSIMTTELREFASADGAAADLVYLNYADASQDPLGSYGPENVVFMKDVARQVPAESSQKVTSFIQQYFSLLAIYLDVRQLKTYNEVVDLLNAGASKVFVTFEQLKVLSQEPTITPDRLVLTISPNNPQTDIGKLKEFLQNNSQWKSSEWAFNGDKGKEYVDSVLAELENYPPNPDQTIYVGIDKLESGEELLHKYPGDSIIVSSENLTFDKSQDAALISVTDLFLAGAIPDRKNGLYATNVVDERGNALGFVWSSRESVAEAFRTGTGVYQSRKRGLWYKGASSGDTQELISIGFDCDKDCLIFRVRQKGRGFCHLGTASCWGPLNGLSRLNKTLQSRKQDAPQGSYTARLFSDSDLVTAKIKEEANELCEASTKEDIAAEAADLFYFALTKCVAAGVSLESVERNLDLKSLKVKRRKGDAKPQFLQNGNEQHATNGTSDQGSSHGVDAKSLNPEKKETVKEAASVPKSKEDDAGTKNGLIQMKRYSTSEAFSSDTLKTALQRPSQKSNEMIMSLVNPIISDVRSHGDSAVLKYTHKFEKATSLKSPVLKAPFPESLMQLPPETIQAINTSFDNILQFHSAQKESAPLRVETMPGVVCSRFSRPIEKVGLYIPGGTAVLPSTAMMLGVPAMAAGCKSIVLASPPRSDGTVTPEIVYIAHRVGAESIILAGGAQAVAAMAYGTESVTKVDKILGPGNQFVTAAKMIVSNDTTAAVSIDMPAGPSEVLVIADKSADPAFVASDLLSQAEHGTDSQVILIAVDLSGDQLSAIEAELHAQANALPRVDIVRGAINHSVTISVSSITEALHWSNYYAPEHLILQVENAASLLPDIQNAGSVFIGKWTPESVGDYSAGVNHSLPTYGYARQYSGVNLGSFMKHITSSELSEEGLKGLGGAVERLAEVEGLEAHKRAVSVRLKAMGK
ncbi:MAG: hypothetical protein Q9227_000214 [Pyrenula ochraceoflavens]